jgi:hypothetical protein
MTLSVQLGRAPRGGAVVNRALAQARASRPFGRPSHTSARSACPIQPHNYLASNRAVRQAELHLKLTGIRAFVSLGEVVLALI